MPGKPFPSMVDADASSMFPSPNRGGIPGEKRPDFARPGRLLMPTKKDALFRRNDDGMRLKPVRKPKAKNLEGFDAEFTVFNNKTKRRKRARKGAKNEQTSEDERELLDRMVEDDLSFFSAAQSQEQTSGSFTPLPVNSNNTSRTRISDDYHQPALPSPLSSAPTPSAFNAEAEAENVADLYESHPGSGSLHANKSSDVHPKRHPTDMSSIENSPASSKTSHRRSSSSFDKIPAAMHDRPGSVSSVQLLRGHALSDLVDADAYTKVDDSMVPAEISQSSDAFSLIVDQPSQKLNSTSVFCQGREIFSRQTLSSQYARHSNGPDTNSPADKTSNAISSPTAVDCTLMSESKFLPAVASTPLATSLRGKQSTSRRFVSSPEIGASPVIKTRKRVDAGGPSQPNQPVDTADRRSFAPSQRQAAVDGRMQPLTSRYTTIVQHRQAEPQRADALNETAFRTRNDVIAADMPPVVPHTTDREKLELFRRLTSAMSVLNIWRPTHLTAEKTLLSQTLFPNSVNVLKSQLLPPHFPENYPDQSGVVTSGEISGGFKTPLPPKPRRSERVSAVIESSKNETYSTKSRSDRLPSIDPAADSNQILMPPPAQPAVRQSTSIQRLSAQRRIAVPEDDSQTLNSSNARSHSRIQTPTVTTTAADLSQILVPPPSLRQPSTSIQQMEQRRTVEFDDEDQTLDFINARSRQIRTPTVMTVMNDSSISQVSMPPPPPLAIMPRRSSMRAQSVQNTSFKPANDVVMQAEDDFVDDRGRISMPLPVQPPIRQSTSVQQPSGLCRIDEPHDGNQASDTTSARSRSSRIQTPTVATVMDDSSVSQISMPPPPPLAIMPRRSSMRAQSVRTASFKSVRNETMQPGVNFAGEIDTSAASFTSGRRVSAVNNMSLLDRFIALQPIINGVSFTNNSIRLLSPNDVSMMHNISISRIEPEPDDPVQALIQLSKSKRVESFQTVIDSMLNQCKAVCKLAEGSYGDVYQFTYNDAAGRGAMKVLKVMALLQPEQVAPGEISGTTYKAALPEVKISTTIAAALQQQPGNNARASGRVAAKKNNYAPSFIHIDPVRIVHGPYPAALHNCFVKFKRDNNEDVAQNPDPSNHPDTQSYLLLESEHAGEELEKVLHRIEQQQNTERRRPVLLTVADCLSLIQQLALALAAAECAIEFEHRDMHRSNIMIRPTNEAFVEFVVAGKQYRVPTGAADGSACGYQAIIIDMTWARMHARAATAEDDDAIVYADMANEHWLFEGEGDLQFDVYRAMRDIIGANCGGDWKGFAPASNVCWLGYVSMEFREYATKLKRHRQRVLTRVAAKKNLITNKHKKRVAAAKVVLNEDEQEEVPPEVPSWTFGTFNQLKGKYKSAMDLVEQHVAFQDLRVAEL